MTTLLQDLRFGARALLRRPLFTIVGVLTLALGIGLNTAVFSAVEALLLRPLAGARAPDELVQVFRTGGSDVLYGQASTPHFIAVRERSSDVFGDFSAWVLVPANLSFGGRNARVVGIAVSADFFRTLGVTMERGRPFVPEEDVGEGAHPVTILGYSTWQRRFGGDPAIVGRPVIVNGRAYTVVGIAPRNFNGVQSIVSPAMYLPLMQLRELLPSDTSLLHSQTENYLSMVARLRPGVSVAQASDRLQAINRDLAAVHPVEYKGSGMLLVRQSEAGIHPMFRENQVQMTALVMAVVAMLLLIACVNVANLFLARASERSREMAIRLSMGAERRRLIRQLLTESILFAVVAGAAGILIASWTIDIANGIRIPMDIEIQPDLRLSAPVLLFTFGLSLLVGVLFGLAPALRATRPQLVPALKGEAPAGGSRSRLSSSLVVAQLALSLVLLVCAGLFLRNLRAASATDKGFVSDHLLVASLDPSLQGYTRERSEQFYGALQERLARQPGVTRVAMADFLPLGLSSNSTVVAVDGYAPAPEESMDVGTAITALGYFETLQIPMRRGRSFSTRDDRNASRVVVVNQQFVDRYLAGREPIGARVTLRGAEWQVVGVTSTGKYRSLGEAPTPFIWTTQAQNWTAAMTVVLKTTGDPALLIAALTAEVAALDPALPLADVKTMEQHLGITLLPSRIAATALGVFGLLGLVLAAVGIYGVMSYAVAQRRREIGIRMAIGSSPAEVLRLVLGQSMRLIAIGTGAGLAGSLAVALLVRGLLLGESALDPVTFVGVPSILVGVALLATWIPARRAAAVDPIAALRAE